jgi:NCS2 family nucleobase:cation symporter-2
VTGVQTCALPIFVSRHVVTIGALFLVGFALLPKFGALVAVMPSAVLGGAAIIMFSMIATSGIVLLTKGELNRRNLLIVAVALGLGLGLGQVPAALAQFHENIRMIFAGSGIVVACTIALILNIILPKDTGREQTAKKEVA